MSADFKAAGIAAIARDTSTDGRRRIEIHFDGAATFKDRESCECQIETLLNQQRYLNTSWIGFSYYEY